MRPPGNYDALRQAEQQAREARETPTKTEAAPELDSAQSEPRRPLGPPAPSIQYSDRGEPVLPAKTQFDAAEIAKAAKEREAAAEQSKGKDDHER